MPTSKKRINISLPPDIEKALGILADRDDMPQATKALHLITMAMELEEDDVLQAIAQKRDTKNAKTFTHKQAWS